MNNFVPDENWEYTPSAEENFMNNVDYLFYYEYATIEVGKYKMIYRQEMGGGYEIINAQDPYEIYYCGALIQEAFAKLAEIIGNDEYQAHLDRLSLS